MRLTQQSVPPCRAAPSGQLDIWHPCSETGALLVMRTFFTKVGDTWSLTSLNLSCYQWDISIIRELYCNLSITGGHQHVAEEVCGGGGSPHLLNNAISGFNHSAVMAHGGLDRWLLGGVNYIIL
jgi:hypothetical protein